MAHTLRYNVILSKRIVGVQINGGERLKIQELKGRQNAVSNFMLEIYSSLVHTSDIRISRATKHPRFSRG